jgi:signal transduction histidine kinase
VETMTQKLNLSQDDLGAILESYSRAAERLKESHDGLQLEVRRLREELASKNRQLERRKRLAALGEMAAGLAHEIRNPLGGIQLFANLLRRDLAERPDLCGTIDKMIKGIKSLDVLVTDVLALTHTVQPKFTSADLAAVVGAAVELVGPHMQEKQSRICWQAPASVPLVCDPNMLQRAVLNLLRNALDAAGSGGQVFVDIVSHRQHVLLQIADTGPGIESEIADKIFNPFFTTKDTGTGLGLAIVHRIVEAHEGTIRISKAPTGGALFTVKMPLTPSSVMQGSMQND